MNEIRPAVLAQISLMNGHYQPGGIPDEFLMLRQKITAGIHIQLLDHILHQPPQVHKRNIRAAVEFARAQELFAPLRYGLGLGYSLLHLRVQPVHDRAERLPWKLIQSHDGFGNCKISLQILDPEPARLAGFLVLLPLKRDCLLSGRIHNYASLGGIIQS